MKRRSLGKRSGAALMLALWALFLLSAMVISWAIDINAQLALTGDANRTLEAEAMAASGAEVATNPQVSSTDSAALHRSLGKNQSYNVRILGEGGRLHLNWILSGENPQRLEVLRKYLEVKGVDINERDRMMDCLLDFVDPDDIPRLNGAESEPGYQPKNALLQRVEELKQVKGWEKFTSRKDWDADFTLYSSGPIDLLWADRDVLLSLPGFNEQIVDRYLQYRRGPDGIDGTADDTPMQSLEQVGLALGFTPQQFLLLTSSGLVSVNDQVVRIVSLGTSSDVKRTIEMVVRKTATPQILRWKEF
jgi:general secretion pathway protein K